MPIKISSTANTGIIEDTEGTNLTFESNKITASGGLFVDVDPSAYSPTDQIAFPGPTAVTVTINPTTYLPQLTAPSPSAYTRSTLVNGPSPLYNSGYSRLIYENDSYQFSIAANGPIDAAGVSVPFTITGPAANGNDLYFPQFPTSDPARFSGSLTIPPSGGTVYHYMYINQDQTTESYPESFTINIPSMFYPAGPVRVEIAEGSYTPQPLGTTPPYKVGGNWLSGTYDYRTGYQGILSKSSTPTKGIRFNYPQPELLAAGFPPGNPVTINSATLYFHQVDPTPGSPLNTFNGFELSLGHHPQNNWPRTNSFIFGSPPSLPAGASQTVVFGPSPVVINSVGAYTIPFSTPYTYPGTGTMQVTAISDVSPTSPTQLGPQHFIREIRNPNGTSIPSNTFDPHWGPPAPSTYPNNQSYVFVYPMSSNGLTPLSFFPNVQYARPVIHFNTT